MALRFNPPPNWPAPPDGFVPPAGWQPDPAWGPAPEGWQLWVDDSATTGPNASAPQSSSGADPAWAPTQAVSTSSSAAVADPTGAPVSAPSGDYASGPMSSPNPMGMSAPSGMSAAPSTSSAPAASPYAANMDYAQAPTPYQNQPYQGLGMPADPQSSWQPGGPDGAAGGSPDKPVTKQWWFWTIIAVVVVALVAVGVVVALNLNKNDNAKGGSTRAGGGGSTHSQPSGDTTGGTPNASNRGRSMDNPASMGDTFTFHASEYSDDPDATVDIAFEEIQWDATQDISKAYTSQTPSADQVYIRLKIKVTYHGKGKFDPFNLQVAYVKDGNSTDTSYVSTNDEFRKQSAPRDGGSASGFVTFLISKSDVKEGVFAISVFFFENGEEVYLKAD